MASASASHPVPQAQDKVHSSQEDLQPQHGPCCSCIDHHQQLWFTRMRT